MRLSLFLLCLYVLVCVGYVQAQTSLEDATAISSLISPQIVLKDVIDEPAKPIVEKRIPDTLKESPWKERDIQFNVKDSSVKGRFIYQLKPRELRFGFEVGGKSANGYTGLFDGSNISSDIKADVFFIYGRIPKDNDTTSEADTMPFVHGQWLGGRVGYRHGEYKLVSSDIPVPSGIEDQNLRGISGLVHYTLLIPGKFFVGASIGGARQNNYGKLPQVEVIDTKSLESSDKNSRIAQISVTARDGNYEEFWLLSADIDLLWIPNFPEETPEETPFTKKGFGKTIGLGAFIRATHRFETTSMPNRTYEPGLGFYLFDLHDEEESSEKSFMSKIAGGIIVSYDREEDKLKFGLITSYNF